MVTSASGMWRLINCSISPAFIGIAHKSFRIASSSLSRHVGRQPVLEALAENLYQNGTFPRKGQCIPGRESEAADADADVARPDEQRFGHGLCHCDHVARLILAEPECVRRNHHRGAVEPCAD